MKYLVMECHDAYAVLMDEDSCFVHAANLNYSVGQTVTDPVLMNETNIRTSITRSMIVRVTAAAACALLVTTAGFGFYSRNMKTQSVMMINPDLGIEMELNSKGKVLKLHSDTDEGQEIIRSYSGKTKDSALAANEILKLQIEHGYISDGDTVDLLIDAEDPDAYTAYKKELEHELSDLKLNVNVQNSETIAPPKPPAPADPPKAPEPPEKDKGKVDPPAPPENDKNDPPKAPDAPRPGDAAKPTPPSPPSEPEPPKDEPAVKPADAPVEPPAGEIAPPDAPDAPEHGKVKPPKPAHKPDRHIDAPEIPAHVDEAELPPPADNAPAAEPAPAEPMLP